MKSLTNVEMNELSEDELMMVDGGGGFKEVAVLTLSTVGTASAGVAAVACGPAAGLAALGAGITATANYATKYAD